MILKKICPIVLFLGLSFAQDLYCVDPQTHIRYPINSTWSSSAFCGNYHCSARYIDLNHGQPHRPSQHIADLSSVSGVSGYNSNHREDHHSDRYEKIETSPENKDSQGVFYGLRSSKVPEVSNGHDDLLPHYGEMPIEAKGTMHGISNELPSGLYAERSKVRGRSTNDKSGGGGDVINAQNGAFLNIDNNFKEFSTDDTDDYNNEDYAAILDEYFTHFANRKGKPLREILQEIIEQIDANPSESRSMETLDTKNNRKDENDTLLYYDHVKHIYTPDKPENFEVYEKLYENYVASTKDAQHDHTGNQYHAEYPPTISSEESLVPPDPHLNRNYKDYYDQEEEPEPREIPEFNTDDYTVLGGWTYSDASNNDNDDIYNNDRAIKELSEEMGVREKTIKLAMIMEDQGMASVEVPTVKYELGSDSESDQTGSLEDGKQAKAGEGSFVDLARNLLRTLSPVSIPLDRSRLSRNQRSSKVSNFRPRIRGGFLAKPRFTRSITDNFTAQSQLIPYITVTTCPDITEPGFYTNGDLSKAFPMCCPQRINY